MQPSLQETINELLFVFCKLFCRFHWYLLCESV